MTVQDPWFTVQQIDSRTYAISEYGHWEKVHSYLLLGTELAVLIDTGLGIANIKRVTDQLTDLPLKVFTTHVHTDHIGSHGAYDAIYVHEQDQDWLINGIQGLSIEEIRRNIIRDIMLPLPEAFDPAAYRPFQGEPAGLLRDGESWELGGRKLRILHTPGHSPGHVCILDETSGYLFTGDLLYDTMPVYAFYPSTNPADLVSSLERIAHLPHIRKVYGSHYSLGLDPAILHEVRNAVIYLRDNGLVRFGTGIHQFNGFSIQF
ncbi:MBL fold metallo-hydrolase [Paenibacillus tengchongensis]|uniref:MBL fold metallo-hydrolase n=1 Tax=Paenibacillus tengchongensis TaxID=2608684 RepID=UPI00124C0F84|nr:MBL fold metallo-hydrolase [Paenibacillus tengchongensis]